MIAPGTVLLDDNLSPGGESLFFADPVEIVETRRAEDVPAALSRLEQAGSEGYWAAGFLAYELGLALEDRLLPRMPRGLVTPLLWFGLYREPARFDAPGLRRFAEAGEEASIAGLTPSLDRAAYQRKFTEAKRLIAAGDIYQVNLTFKARFRLKGDPLGLYRQLMSSQKVAFGALVATGGQTILSRSPELFVRNTGGELSMRPMKGTALRGPTGTSDEAERQALQGDAKNRAENLMIVDMLRNDLGRIAEMGSVAVTDLYSVESFRSLHQMTSGIEARLRPGTGLAEIFRALFPSGSVTGAPKIRAMEIISEIENEPRGVYTGAIGCISPKGDFRFNVAIRTVVIGAGGEGEIGIGGGIVADSTVEAEYDEAVLKMKFLAQPAKDFSLIETLLWERGKGFALAERHFSRLANSAAYAGFPLAPGAAGAALQTAALSFAEPRQRVRLLLDADGTISVSATALPPGAPKEVSFILAQARVDSADWRLYHKTTLRDFLDAPRQAANEEGVDEVVFRNERGEVTEGSYMTLFIRRDGVLLTPALISGLLPGTLRAELLARGEAQEAVLHVHDLESADEIFLGNSVRGLQRARFLREG